MSFGGMLFGGFTAAAAILIVTATAWACVPYFGSLQVTITGDGTDRDTGTVEGKGAGGDHRYCSPGDINGVTPVQEGLVTGGDTLTITIRKGTVANCGGVNPTALTQGWNEILFTNATTDAKTPFSMTGTSWSVRQNSTGCWASSPVPDGNITLASFSLDSTKTATLTRTLPANLNSVDASNRASMLCIGTRSVDAIPVPIRVTSTT